MGCDLGGLDNVNAVAKTILQSVYSMKFHFTAVRFLGDTHDKGIASRIEDIQLICKLSLFYWEQSADNGRNREKRGKKNKVESREIKGKRTNRE